MTADDFAVMDARGGGVYLTCPVCGDWLTPEPEPKIDEWPTIRGCRKAADRHLADAHRVVIDGAVTAP